MMWLTLDDSGIICTEAMLKHERFLLAADISGDSWTLYSEEKFLLLEQKLLQQMAIGPRFDPNSRISRLLLGNTVELVRKGALLPLDAEIRGRLGIKRVQICPE